MMLVVPQKGIGVYALSFGDRHASRPTPQANCCHHSWVYQLGKLHLARLFVSPMILKTDEITVSYAFLLPGLYVHDYVMRVRVA